MMEHRTAILADRLGGRKHIDWTDRSMISYVKGPLVAIEGDTIVVEAGAVGLAIHVPLSVLDALPKTGQQVTIYTYFQVKEDAMSLYGFLTRQDRDMFRQLIGVSGIGPKAGLGLLSALRPDDLRLAIITGDAKAISKAPGIGAKTAQRLILDLKDKMSAQDVLERLGSGDNPALEVQAPGAASESAKEAVQALVALGYTVSEASRAVGRVEGTEEMTAEEVLKASLRFLAF